VDLKAEAVSTLPGLMGPGKAESAPGETPTNLLERCLEELVRYCRHCGAGKLVTGIVHRMNTPLQVLSFQLELLEQKNREELELPAFRPPACPPPVTAELKKRLAYREEKFRQFRRQLEELQSLARCLLVQGVHETGEQKQLLDLNQVWGDVLELYLANPFFKHRVKRKIRLQPGLSPIYGYYLDFSQSFRNLLDNALEALEATARRELTITTAPENGWLILDIEDSGNGIPPRDQPLIFQPFFTTKPGHAGLGLFLARRLLAPYGGEVLLDCAPGGTRARVRLPI
jgi:signal transduction histidine kinase